MQSESDETQVRPSNGNPDASEQPASPPPIAPFDDGPSERWWNRTAWLAAIVDSSDDAIVGKTLDGTIRSWNDGARRIFGYTAEEIVGRSIRLLIPANLQREEDEIVARLSRGERIDHFETVRVRRDGSQVEVSLSVSPIRDASGRIVGAAKIARDVTEANRLRQVERDLTARAQAQAEELQVQAVELENQVEEAQSLQEDLELANEQLARAIDEADEARRRAESANRAKSQFLTTMSHELRTPLNAIAGYVELMELGLRGPVTSEQLGDLARIKRSQQVLLRLIDDILDHAKLESGQTTFKIADFPIAPVLQNVEAFAQPLLSRKPVEYRLVGCPDHLVHADPAKVEQILLNLLSNAAKFTTKGSIEVHCERHGATTAIKVVDTGCGIPANMLESIFDPFIQVNSDLTRTAEGTGLGLAISRQLARAMGGDVTVKSTVSVGSEFSLTLPAVEAHG
jgi:PAS domain S-box-containing protein